MNTRGRSKAVTRSIKKCMICWKNLKLTRAGKLMWYKPSPVTMAIYNLDPKKYWKELVCNHFIDGQSSNRNAFCHYHKAFGKRAIREANSEEVNLTYHIVGEEEPRLAI